MAAGSQVVSLNNTIILSPNLTWTQRIGFNRLRAYANTEQDFTPSQFGINLLGSQRFSADPDFQRRSDPGQRPRIRSQHQLRQRRHVSEPGRAGNQLNWVKGRHTLSFGAQYDGTQLNIVNNNTDTDTIGFTTFTNFVEGVVKTGTSSLAFNGSASRYYRSHSPSLFVNDNYKLRSNLTLTLGLRWDYEGPLTEKYGRLTGVQPEPLFLQRSPPTRLRIRDSKSHVTIRPSALPGPAIRC